MSILNYPPQEIIEPSNNEKKNFEHLILWVLANNENCEWSDFRNHPVNINQSTLSIYMNKLIANKRVDRIKHGYYKITTKGEERFRELSRAIKFERTLRYPPMSIIKRRNYADWILWMLYNNNYCKWSDFIEKPLSINNSSLSKNLDLLKDSELVRKEDKKYHITQEGKIEYAKMLRSYDLDRQSILEEESKRMVEKTKKIKQFLSEHNVKESNLKFRFVRNYLKFNYYKVKDLISKESFSKILLYLSINHPENYPNHITLDDFAEKYDIERRVLDYFIYQLVDDLEDRLFPVKIFKLEVNPSEIYYFQVGEKTEQVLRAYTEENIIKYTYLNRLDKGKSQRIIVTIAMILSDVCGKLFDIGLKSPLKKFLPEYIEYLAYKIDTEEESTDVYDRPNLLIWHSIKDLINNQIDSCYQIDNKILDIIDSYHKSEEILNLSQQVKSLIKLKKVGEALEIVNKKFESNKLNNSYRLIKSVIYCYNNEHWKALKLLNKALETNNFDEEDEIFVYISFIFSFCFIALGMYEKAYNIAEDLVNQYSQHPITHATRGLVFGYNIFFKFDEDNMSEEEALNELNKAIKLDTRTLNKARYYQFQCSIYKSLRKFESGLIAIDKAIELSPKTIDLYYWKIQVFSLSKKYSQALKLVNEKLGEFDNVDKILYSIKANILRFMGDIDTGLKIYDFLAKLYPYDYEIFNNLAYWYMYKHKEIELTDRNNNYYKDLSLKAINLAIKNDPTNPQYYDTWGEILGEFGEYDKAIENLHKAIDMDPKNMNNFYTYINLGKYYEKKKMYDKAMEYLTIGSIKMYNCYCNYDIELQAEAQVLIKKINKMKKNKNLANQ